MVVRSELERRRAEEQIEYLRSELQEMSTDEQQDEVARSVMSGLRMQISDIENRLAEYERLKKGSTPILTADNFDDIGELVIKARVARGWSQAELARALDMEQQQVQRYEKNDWQKISLWRLQEVVEALGLEVSVRAWLHDQGTRYGELPQIAVDREALASFSNTLINSGAAGVPIESHGNIMYGGLQTKPSETPSGAAYDIVRTTLMRSQSYGRQTNAPKVSEYGSFKDLPARQDYAA